MKTIIPYSLSLILILFQEHSDCTISISMIMYIRRYDTSDGLSLSILLVNLLVALFGSWFLCSCLCICLGKWCVSWLFRMIRCPQNNIFNISPSLVLSSFVNGVTILTLLMTCSKKMYLPHASHLLFSNSVLTNTKVFYFNVLILKLSLWIPIQSLHFVSSISVTLRISASRKLGKESRLNG